MSKTESQLLQDIKPEEFGLAVENLSRKLNEIKAIIPNFESLIKDSEAARQYLENEITRYAISIRAAQLDKDELKNFFNHPYHIYKTNEDQIKEKHGQYQRHLAMPKFCGIQLGYMETMTESHYVFLVNPFVDMINEIPDALKKEMNMPDPLDIVLDGEYLRGPDVQKIKAEFAPFIIKQIDKNTLKMDPEQHWKILVNLLKKNIRPFAEQPISEKDLVERKCDFELRTYQKRAWGIFKKYSHLGIYWAPNLGKTFIGVYGCSKIISPHLISVPTTSLIEQWTERFDLYTDLNVGNWSNPSEAKQVIQGVKDGKIDVVITTYQGAIKYCHEIKWKLKITDEVQHMPANMFSKLITIPSDYSMGLSATPQREDDREEYIFAFSGKSEGLNWNEARAIGLIQNPDCHIHIIKSEKERWVKLQEILNEPTMNKTWIFSDFIKDGLELSRKLNMPFVYSKTKDKMKILKENKNTIVSRIADEGLSFDISKTIEVSWLFGSRRQELQRVGRLLHNKTGELGQHHVIMTGTEYQMHHKRFFSLYDKGFKVIIHREGKDKKEIQKTTISAEIADMINQNSLEGKKPSKINLVKINPIFGTEKLRGLIKQCNNNEKICLKIMFNKPHMKYARSLLFKSCSGRFRDFASFQKLVALHLIKNVGPQLYQANTEILK